MKAEIIAVGSELLLGDTVNTNAAWISRRLAEIGIDVHHHVTVGDNPARIKTVIAQALDRSDLLVFTGGLGPTDDDLTVATIAEYFDTPLVSDPASEEAIRRFFITRDTPMSDTNIKQALRPEDAEVIKNPMGTAPGLAWDISARAGKPAYILAFPGVPKELYAMWEDGRLFLEARQAERGQQPTRLFATFLHFFGIGESRLGEVLGDLMARDNPTVAPYVGRAEVNVRIAAKTDSREKADQLIEPVKAEILNRLGKYYYGENEDSLEGRVADLLKNQGLTVGVAESCTGGLVSHRLTEVPGASAYTMLNVVTYGNEQKTGLLGVRPETLGSVGAVSAETAGEMAEGIRRVSGCDIGLSTTGIAGPNGGSDEKPVGLVYIGLCGVDGEVITRKITANPRYGRADVKYWFSQYALHFLRLYLESELTPD